MQTRAVSPLLQRQHWIFDLDGTLTVPCHNFAQIKDRLGIPHSKDILTFIDEKEPAEAAHLHAKLVAEEEALVRGQQASAGADTLLRFLKTHGYSVGILTRNTKHIAKMTLDEVGLAHHFHDSHILGRHEAKFKPEPDGIFKLLSTWNAEPHNAVMVGDFVYDLAAGRNAGVHTLHVATDDESAWPDVTDVRVRSFEPILAAAQAMPPPSWSPQNHDRKKSH